MKTATLTANRSQSLSSYGLKGSVTITLSDEDRITASDAKGGIVAVQGYPKQLMLSKLGKITYDEPTSEPPPESPLPQEVPILPEEPSEAPATPESAPEEPQEKKSPGMPAEADTPASYLAQFGVNVPDLIAHISTMSAEARTGAWQMFADALLGTTDKPLTVTVEEATPSADEGGSDVPA